MTSSQTKSGVFHGVLLEQKEYEQARSKCLDAKNVWVRERAWFETSTSTGKSPTLAKKVRSLLNFRGGHELFMFDPKEEESLQKIRDRYCEKSSKNIT